MIPLTSSIRMFADAEPAILPIWLCHAWAPHLQRRHGRILDFVRREYMINSCILVVGPAYYTNGVDMFLVHY
jgi:hypothetical protein